MNPELMSGVLMLLNAASMAAVFIYSACSLSVKKWTWRQPELWIHALLIGGSVAVIGHTANSGQPHHLTEVLFNVAAACFFMLRSRRIHLLDGILKRKTQRLPEKQKGNGNDGTEGTAVDCQGEKPSRIT